MEHKTESQESRPGVNRTVVAVIVGLLVLLLVGGGAFMLGRNGDGNEEASQTVAGEPNGGDQGSQPVGDEPAAATVPADVLSGTWYAQSTSPNIVTFNGNTIAWQRPQNKPLLQGPYSLNGATITLDFQNDYDEPAGSFMVRYYDGDLLIMDDLNSKDMSQVDQVFVCTREDGAAKSFVDDAASKGVGWGLANELGSYTDRLFQEGILNPDDNLIGK